MSAFMIVALMIGFGAVGGYYLYKRNASLANSGYLIARPANFQKMSQTYYLSEGDYVRVYKEIIAGDYSKVGVKILHDDTAEVLLFEGSTWKGQLVHNENTASKSVYEFRFTRWRNSKYGVRNLNDMNMVLTQVEKALLRIDYDTDVVTKMFETKTKPDIL